MGVVFHGVPKQLVESLHREFGLRVFVETGTFRGETSEWATGVFDRVYSVEAAPALQREARERLKGKRNLEIEGGESRAFLERMVRRLDEPAIFWLDAHWCASPETHGIAEECPLLGELEVLATSNHSNFILIDDARMFLAPPDAPHDFEKWPTIADLARSPCLGGPERFTAVFEDVIVTVPRKASHWLAGYLRHQRLLESEDQLRKGLKLTATGLRGAILGLRQETKRRLRTLGFIPR